MLVGVQFLHLANMDWDLYLVMIVGVVMGIYFYHLLREVHLGYVGILGSVIAVAFCEFLSVLGIQAVSGELLSILSYVLPIFEFFLIPFVLGQLGMSIYYFIKKRVLHQMKPLT